jgi:protocatechuate 3,4-dioxygenase beta subunit
MAQPARLVLALTFMVGLLARPTPSHAQAITGTLLGNVTDSSGAPVPGVTVTATESETNVGRTVVSNEAGRYIFSSLLNG